MRVRYFLECSTTYYVEKKLKIVTVIWLGQFGLECFIYTKASGVKDLCAQKRVHYYRIPHNYSMPWIFMPYIVVHRKRLARLGTISVFYRNWHGSASNFSDCSRFSKNMQKAASIRASSRHVNGAFRVVTHLCFQIPSRQMRGTLTLWIQTASSGTATLRVACSECVDTSTSSQLPQPTERYDKWNGNAISKHLTAIYLSSSLSLALSLK